MLLRHFMLNVGPLEANAYLMADLETKAGLLVDAGDFDLRIVELADEYDLNMVAILITHLHWDHVDGLAEYAKQWPEARVIAPAPSAAAPGAHIVGHGDRFKAGPLEFEVFKTSGHTPESVSYYCRQAGVCFVGDAIFAGSVGGTADDALFAEEIGHIRAHLLTLPDETELWSGHGPMTTVGIERAANPFLQPGFGRQAP
jgi:glyoxylase-like metal-dependent hydrolase (beta-lactamase superfamily II)